MTLYDTLGVAPNATKAEIRRAAKRAKQRSHPDRAGGSEAQFKSINAAARLLTDDSARKRYDQTGETGPESPPELTDEQHAVIVLGKIFIAIIDKLKDGDPIAIARAEITKGITEGPVMIVSQQLKLARIEKALKKHLKQKANSTPFLQNVLITHIAKQRTVLEQMELAARLGPIMLKILSDYSWQDVASIHNYGLINLSDFIHDSIINPYGGP